MVRVDSENGIGGVFLTLDNQAFKVKFSHMVTRFSIGHANNILVVLRTLH